MNTKTTDSIDVAFRLGLAAGLASDPHVSVSELRDREARHRVTGLRSRWLHRRCEVCGHSFRLGDEVLVQPPGRVVHDMPGLRCATGAPPDTQPGGAAQADAFFAGLIAAWPLPDDVPLTRLEPGHWLMAPPSGGHRRAACRVCGHTFRPYDQVVICPCDPVQPRCRAAVHRDLLKGLHCWDLWLCTPHHSTSCLGMS